MAVAGPEFLRFRVGGGRVTARPSPEAQRHAAKVDEALDNLGAALDDVPWPDVRAAMARTAAAEVLTRTTSTGPSDGGNRPEE